MGYHSDAALREYKPSDKAICGDHLLDDSLIDRLTGLFTQDECDFCGVQSENVAVEVDELLSIGMEKVHIEYTPADDYGASLYDLGTDYSGGQDTGEVFADIFDGSIDEDVVEEIRACGGDGSWVADSLFYLDEQQRMAHTWESFVEQVKHRRRFWFTKQADAGYDPERLTVGDFFERVASVLTRPGITETWPKDSIIWRGRMVKADEDPADYDGKELGSPPVQYAAANRMSPAGVSMFYGGDTPDVVVAEIGAHSTFNHAIYGSFTTLTDMNIVDLTNLPPVPGYFTEYQSERLVLAFLHDFVADLVKPIILDGREHIDYVPTQIVTEYLRHFTEKDVHGLRFASSQFPSGLNTVLFCDNTRCVNPPGTDLNQDGWPPAEAHTEKVIKFPHLMPWLQFNPNSVKKAKTTTAIAT